MKYLITLLLLFISISSKAQIPEDIPKVYIPPFYDVWWVHLYDYKVCEYNYPDSRLVDKKKSPTTNVCYNCRNIYNSLKQNKFSKAMEYIVSQEEYEAYKNDKGELDHYKAQADYWRDEYEKLKVEFDKNHPYVILDIETRISGWYDYRNYETFTIDIGEASTIDFEYEFFDKMESTRRDIVDNLRKLLKEQNDSVQRTIEGRDKIIHKLDSLIDNHNRKWYHFFKIKKDN